ncbi:GGDEF domain-containing protein [Pseudoduganella sp. OTU4001]|uniref:GGDEF domain-containing protein n=1 Tax=Pseudoduganella sp. OTU4001 TaxID=3043854 RepID=UPI00313E28D3
MFTFDVATATFLIGFLSLLIACAFRGPGTHFLDGSASGQWALSALLGAAAAFLTTFGAGLPPLFTTVADNVLSIACLVFVHRGMAIFIGVPPPDRAYCAALAVSTLAFAWFGLIQPQLEIRIAIVALARAGFCCATLLLLARPDLPFGARYLAAILAMACAWNIMRLAVAMATDADSTQFLRAGTSFAVMAAIGGILNVLINAFQFRLASERICDELAGRASRLTAQRDELHAIVLERTAEQSRLANTDSLTGLANRRHFMEHGSREVSRARRYRQPLAMLLLDIDHFKEINDNFGHPAGDKVIAAVANACRTSGRGSDLAGRIGGEEFAVLLPETNAIAAQLAAERLRRKIADLDLAAHGITRAITASIGVAVLQGSETALEALLARADQALYLAKQTGRNRVVST